MGSPTSVTTENPEPRGKGGTGSKGTPVATDDIDAAYSDERPPEALGLARPRRPGC